MADEASMKYSGPAYQILSIRTEKFKTELQWFTWKRYLYCNYRAHFGKRLKVCNSMQKSFMFHKVIDFGKSF